MGFFSLKESYGGGQYAPLLILKHLKFIFLVWKGKSLLLTIHTDISCGLFKVKFISID